MEAVVFLFCALAGLIDHKIDLLIRPLAYRPHLLPSYPLHPAANVQSEPDTLSLFFFQQFNYPRRMMNGTLAMVTVSRPSETNDYSKNRSKAKK